MNAQLAQRIWGRFHRTATWIAGASIGMWLLVTLWVAAPSASVGALLTGGVSAIFILTIWAFRRRTYRALVLLGVVTVGAVVLGTTVRPRNDRAWAFDVAHAPWADTAGDVVTIHNYRNFDWRSASTASASWETKVIRLQNLKHMDLFMTYWGSPHLCHTMVSFDFGLDGKVGVSVEARREEGEVYSPIAGAFRGYELIYVFGDERDLVRLRTHFRPHNQVYVFRFKADAAAARIEFLEFIRSANAVKMNPRWYNTFVTNCTTEIRRHAAVLKLHDPWDWRILLNGYVDEYLYAHGYFRTELPLPELKAQSLIHPTDAMANGLDFSDRIRAQRPGF